MDRLAVMRVFVRIVERGGFGRAADDLGLSRARATQAIQQLEAHLGTQLLRRTTRQVQLTSDGAAFYARCVRLLDDLDEAESLFRAGAAVDGVLRISLPASLSRLVVVPRLPDFCREHPALQLELSANDRPVDVVREGFDAVLRAGRVHDQSLARRPLTPLRQVTCASPAYLRAHGEPGDIDALDGHVAVNYQPALGGPPFDFEFQVGERLVGRRLPGPLTVNGADAYVAACEAGLGLIQAPHYHVAPALAAGRLREVLPALPPPPLPLAVLYPAHRQMTRRLRVFIDWLANCVDRWGAP